MAAWTLFVLGYLLGIATPTLVLRQLLRRRGDSSACILEVILATLLMLCLVTVLIGTGEM